MSIVFFSNNVKRQLKVFAQKRVLFPLLQESTVHKKTSPETSAGQSDRYRTAPLLHAYSVSRVQLRPTDFPSSEDELRHEEAERNGGEKTDAARQEEGMIDDEGTAPLAHVGPRVVAGDGEGGGGIDIRHKDARHRHEAGEDHRSVAPETRGHRNEQSRRRTLTEEERRNAEERKCQQPRVLRQEGRRLFLNRRDINADHGGRQPADAENHDEGFVAAVEDAAFLDLREFHVAEPVHQQRNEEHRDHDDVTGTERVADFLLKEKHHHDEDHGEKEDAHGELSTLGKGRFLLFLRSHRDETGLHAGLEDRVLIKIHALEGRNQRRHGRAEEPSGENHHQRLAERDAHRFNDDPHRSGRRGNRGSGNRNLRRHNGRRQGLRRTHVVLLGDFLHNVQNRHRRKARPREDREDEAQSRCKNVDVLRIVSENMGRHAHHVVHAASDVHHRARKEHGHDDEDHVQRHRSRGQPQAENGDEHAEAAGHTDADTAQLSRIYDAAQEQKKMYPNHDGSLFLFIKSGSGRVTHSFDFMTTAMKGAGGKTTPLHPNHGHSSRTVTFRTGKIRHSSIRSGHCCSFLRVNPQKKGGVDKVDLDRFY